MSRPASAIILAGGKGSRIGGDKPLRLLRGRTLLEHALGLARAVADDLVIADGAGLSGLPAGVRAAPDDPAHAGCGPLAGVLAGLKLARNHAVLVLACDLPNVTPALARALLSALETADCAWCRHAADEPLLVALRRDVAAPAIAAALAAGRNKVMPVWQSLASRVLTGPELAAFGPPEVLFANVNSPEDLQRENLR